MAIVRYEESSGLLTYLREEVVLFFKELLGNANSTSTSTIEWIPSVVTDWVPAIDVKEDDYQYEIYASIPGVKSIEEIEITIESGVLTIKGEKKPELEKGCGRMERTQGSFYRRFSLPHAVDDVTAKFRKGALTIVIPKHEIIKPNPRNNCKCEWIFID